MMRNRKRKSQETRAVKRTWLSGQRKGEEEKYIDEISSIRSEKTIAKAAMLLAIIGMYGYLSWQVSGSEFAMLEQVKNPGFALGNCSQGLRLIINQTDRATFIERCEEEFRNQLSVAQSAFDFVSYVGWLVPVSYLAQVGYFKAAIESIQFQKYQFEQFVKAYEEAPKAKVKMCDQFKPTIEILTYARGDLDNMSQGLAMASSYGFSIKATFVVQNEGVCRGKGCQGRKPMIWYQVFVLQKIEDIQVPC